MTSTEDVHEKTANSNSHSTNNAWPGDRMSRSLQENFITLLCHSDEHGGIVAAMTRPEMYEAECRVIATAAIQYWREYKQAPKLHSTDLLKEILEDETDSRRRRLQELLFQITVLSQAINSEFVLRQLRLFVRMQQLKAALIESAGHLNDTSGMGVERVEQLLTKALRNPHAEFDIGVRGSNLSYLLEYLRQTQDDEFCMGIPELDKHHVCPGRQKLMVALGPVGSGKTWLLTHLGTRALRLRKRVLHVTLEISIAEMMERYVQAVLSVAQRQAHLVAKINRLKLDDTGALTGLEPDTLTAPFALRASGDEPGENAECLAALSHLMAKSYEIKKPAAAQDEPETKRVLGKWSPLDQLLVKKFTTGSLTPHKLRGYLEMLQASGFKPDMVVLDYLGLLYLDPENLRISLGRATEELRGLAEEMNFALVTAQQAGREGYKAKETNIVHVAEDWSIVHTSDVVLSFSRSRHEKDLGLARLRVDKHRAGAEGMGVVLSQNLWHGQFALQSCPLDAKKYLELIGEG